MVRGAIHPNGSNFRRAARLDVVARMRKLCDMKLIEKRPQWLEWCERVPPMENHNLNLQTRTVRNPYPRMVEFLLKKYPDLRFQDCYVDGNDWSCGNDTYRDDHPAMQFVARQLDLMRRKGLSKKQAFAETEEMFRDRRERLEREQKVMMAMALDSGVTPMFTTGRAYLEVQKANAEVAHLKKIRMELRKMRDYARKEVEEGYDQKLSGRRREVTAIKQLEAVRQSLVGGESEESPDSIETASDQAVTEPLREETFDQAPVLPDDMYDFDEQPASKVEDRTEPLPQVASPPDEVDDATMTLPPSSPARPTQSVSSTWRQDGDAEPPLRVQRALGSKQRGKGTTKKAAQEITGEGGVMGENKPIADEEDDEESSDEGGKKGR
mmetsp:Transcript_40846/g.89363  ORF Transcript_40846/g.89363 Transcript_40846/m.89363 type:complete len:381 (+) Transcript_40846:41-1183(+)|eukprot:CAMPEP_0170585424 /NCGR_PEP_ID=MMETSP0224-20130122/9203_1 /TAXON_ID=285029 /ORGANISM="Togula jolla, Strain CCCM 725" /LENGTH=380 /DNA_ID=CAMNT_0010908901 /DNA_START=10 /DNA_END=1152 /DNA_ORIENTATION=+